MNLPVMRWAGKAWRESWRCGAFAEPSVAFLEDGTPGVPPGRRVYAFPAGEQGTCSRGFAIAAASAAAKKPPVLHCSAGASSR